MKILVISANTALYPDPVYPFGAAIVASAAQRCGHDVSTFDCCFFKDWKPALGEHLRNHSPEIIGISMRNVDDISFPCPVSFTEHYISLITECRKNSCARIVIGGSAVSLYPDEYISLLKPDHCIAGEGEKSFVELIETIQSGNQPPVFIRAPRLNPEEISTANRSLFNIVQYYDCGGCANIQSKRGCAFSCSFCTFPHLEGGSLRLRHPCSVADELEAISDKHQIKDFFFVDSVFNYPEKHARAICCEIIKRKLKIRWTCYMRPEPGKMELPAIMKEAGCTGIEIGSESMSEPILKSMNKGLGVDDIFRFCSAFTTVRMPFCHGIIFGMPGETRQTADTTVRNVEATMPAAAIAVPGVRVYKNTLLAQTLVKSFTAESEYPFGLKPYHYISPEVKDWLVPFVSGLPARGKNWIIPGNSQNEIEVIGRMRQMKKRGPAWQFKQMARFAG